MTSTAGFSIRECYDAIFRQECEHSYPAIDALEARLGFALDRERLEGAARTLACPLKVNPPNWQHGRLLYAVVRSRLEYLTSNKRWFVLDIGTAKGFSALCMQWALADLGAEAFARVVSVDAVDPLSRERRNSVAELDGLLTVPEFVAPWPASAAITFTHTKASNWRPLLQQERIVVAFVDGKHTQDAVARDAALVAKHQELGDVMVFDDMHIPGIAAAVHDLHGYDVERIDILPNRAYAIATRC